MLVKIIACVAEVEQGRSSAKSKSAKKNEKRKQKKIETDTTTASRKQTDSIAEQLEESLQ